MPLIITSNGKAKLFTVRQKEMRNIALEEMGVDDSDATQDGSIPFGDAADQIAYDADELFDSAYPNHPTKDKVKT